MKILLVANTDWYLFRFRLDLARFLRDQGEDVIFVSPSGQYVSQLESDGFRWMSWEVGRQSINPIKEAGAIFRLLRVIKQEAPDIIHLHTVKPVLYGSICVRFLKNIAFVCSITGRGYVFLGDDVRASLLRPLIKAIYRFAFASYRGIVIFENKIDLGYFVDQKLVQPKKAIVVEGVGVDTDYYAPMPEPNGIPVVVLAGRLLWDKGVGTFMEAARLLRSRVSVRCVLVGQPDLGNPASIPVEIIESWVREGVLEWWGWKSDMREVFSNCHIVTLPSLGEGLPTILLEAASSGRPIVTTDVPGCRDVVVNGVNGLTVPPQEPSALALALEDLILDSEKRKSMGRAGRDLVIRRFSTSIVNSSTIRIYQQVVGNAYIVDKEI
jgi:glycosyltransferase involved in cell wall biosynthesis